MDESAQNQNRRGKRSPVMLTAMLELAGDAQPVILRNLSAGGALVEGKCLPAEGCPILFARKDLRIQARVAWIEGCYAGIAFERPLAREEVLRQVPKPRGKFESRFRRPGLASSPLSEADRRMLQLWASLGIVRAN